MALVVTVLGGCTGDPDADDPTEAGSTTATEAPTDDATATDDGGATTTDDTSPSPTEDEDGDGGASPSDADATGDDGSASDDGVSAVPSDASEPDQALAIVDQLYALEQPIREDLADRAQDGDILGEIIELADRFRQTRTLEAAQAEAEELFAFGAENLAPATEGGVVLPTLTDVTVEAARDGCIVMTATTDVLTTYNDQGQVELRYRLVTGEGNGTGWLIDRISTGEVPDC